MLLSKIIAFGLIIMGFVCAFGSKRNGTGESIRFLCLNFSGGVSTIKHESEKKWVNVILAPHVGLIHFFIQFELNYEETLIT